MSNRAIWDIRKRHVWLATPSKPKRLKRRERLRVGVQQALDRKAPAHSPAEPPAES
jgi:hypothetical protein